MDVFFESWAGVARVLVVGTFAYAATVAVLRVTGKRTLSKMNAFDLIVTIALGSALATTILSRQTPLIEGMTALILLVVLQYAVTWLSVRYEGIQSLVNSQPTLLVHKGRFLRQAMRRERIAEEEIRAAMRSNGAHELNEDFAVVLESDGSLSVFRGFKASGSEELEKQLGDAAFGAQRLSHRS